MCWSLEVSVAAGTIAYTTALLLWTRNATPRDRWNSIFLFVFSTMQWIDACIWYLVNQCKEGSDCVVGAGCPSKASFINIAGLMVIILEPLGCLAGSMYARRKWFTKNEFLCYIVFNLLVLFSLGYIFPPLDCRHSGRMPCPYLTNDNHILYTIGTDKVTGGPTCFRKYGFFGSPSNEIPLWLRFAFLIGMVYPYLVYMKPLGSGIIQSLVLISTWMVGYFSDSHASVWCAANVIQVVTMYMDPFWFPPVRFNVDPGSQDIKPKLHSIYSKRKVDNIEYDYIIVGSGIGGLSCGALLSKAGYRVLILEQHSTVGGCTHEFKQNGDYFDSGIHYIGGSSMVRNLLSMITIKPGVSLSKMGSQEDGYLYDEFDLGEGLIVRFRSGKDEMRKELLKHFPEERDGINKYFECMREATSSLSAVVLVKALPEWILNISFIRRYLFRQISKACSKTATEVVNSCVKDKRLRALLSAGQLIDWNLKPDECSWSVVGSMASYYINGGYYPVGGSSKVAQRVVPIIEHSGGQVLVHARVSQLVSGDDGVICGVKMENGDVLKPKYAVVSDMGLVNTFKALPEHVLTSKGLDREIPGSKPSNGHMTAFINLDGPPSSFDLRSTNIHSWTDLHKFDYDPNKMQEAFYENPFENSKGCLMTLTCPAAKDPQYAVDQPNKSNVLLLTEAKWDWFKDMNLEEVKALYENLGEGAAHGKRPKEYLDFKKKWEEIFLERLYKYYPKTKGHVVGIQIGTPVTSSHFIASHKGGSYGMAWTPDHFSEELLTKYLNVKSRIPGLFIAGESALFGGFVGMQLYLNT
uniref:Amine oxidase domain-containing protein n=1 Tax=Aplanochytrium stocchinoi TaxID=215587 RepID=A0A7S3V0T1_9STRA|mmetsp:Transcript_14598/g.16983  ORF Transcript_14598/g.16983 Transcript_14598/m.16983 type:complete len:806 (+) Transcript_14598:72-2489(+)